jgi:hypothetical protein
LIPSLFFICDSAHHPIWDQLLFSFLLLLLLLSNFLQSPSGQDGNKTKKGSVCWQQLCIRPAQPKLLVLGVLSVTAGPPAVAAILTRRNPLTRPPFFFIFLFFIFFCPA